MAQSKYGNGLMKTGRLKNCLLGAVSAGVLLAMPVGAAVGAADQIMIAEQSLGAALKSLSRQRQVHILYKSELVNGKKANAISGAYDTREILDKLLEGQGLEYKIDAKGNVYISAAMVSAMQDTNAGAMTEAKDVFVLEEIVVTATKRETGLQDTAMSISALGADTIEKRGLNSMGDYLNTLPGVTMQDRGAGRNSIVIRGIAVDPALETEAVGVYFGETPVTGFGLYRSGHADFKMVDIERVEVLRGPQGTLYGSGSMGGTVRIIPAVPNLEEVEGMVSVEYSETAKNGSDNSILQGMVNLPVVTDKLAVRAVAYKYDNSGYVKNVAGSYEGESAVLDKAAAFGGIAVDADSVGREETKGFRVAALWQPTERLALTLSHSWQDTVQQGLPEIDLSLPPYQQISLMPGGAAVSTMRGDKPQPEGLRANIHLTNLQVDYDLDWGSLMSSSSWLDYKGSQAVDYTFLTPGPYHVIYHKAVEVFIEELRFASAFEGPVQFLTGAYYEDRDSVSYDGEGFSGALSKALDYVEAAGFAVPPVPDDAPEGFVWTLWHQDDQPSPLTQKALFGELSYDITDRLTATVGIRHYEYDQSYQVVVNGFYNGVITPQLTTDLSRSFKGETYKANLSWKPNDDTLVYAQWGQGFRLGKPISHIPQCDDGGFYDLLNGNRVPVRSFTDPDKLENYELGYKASFVDGRVSINASAYHINWEGLPVQVALACDTGGSTFINAGKSTSEGVEIESRVHIGDHFRLDLSASYNEAKLAADAPGLGSKGTDLPGSADFNLSAGLEYGFILSGYDAYVRADYAYVGAYNATIDQSATVPTSGDYSQVHLKAGVTFDQVMIGLFVKNLTNADNLTWTDRFTQFGSTRGMRIRPRTIGVNVSYNF